jgi:hypothetical protein
VQVGFAAGKASYRVSNLSLFDFGNIPNALFGPRNSAIPATVSFDVEWSGVDQRARISDPTEPFVADVIYGSATMSFTATSGGATFVSDPASTSHSVFAELGHERNGRFFS